MGKAKALLGQFTSSLDPDTRRPDTHRTPDALRTETDSKSWHGDGNKEKIQEVASVSARRWPEAKQRDGGIAFTRQGP